MSIGNFFSEGFSGAGKGAFWGGIAGLVLGGIAAIFMGPEMLLVGAALGLLGGAVAGGGLGALMGLFTKNEDPPSDEAKQIAKLGKNITPEQAQEVMEVMAQNNLPLNVQTQTPQR